MLTFSKSDLRLCTFTASDGQRYIVAEFVDDDNSFSMAFFTHSNGMYTMRDIPKGFTPSDALNETLWQILGTEDQPPLALASGGYYHGHEFHTLKGTAQDFTIIAGDIIEKIVASDGKVYDLVFSEQGDKRIVYFGLYAGTHCFGTDRECDLFRPFPVPKVLLDNRDEMLNIYALADDVDATFLHSSAVMN
jgi:hypothetical protein